jgi:hypothetical protein
MTAEIAGKPMTWTRWAVTVESSDPMGTYAMLWRGLEPSERFRARAFGITDTEVRVVVEYTAAGANSDDIKRRFVGAGVERRAVGTTKIASVDMGFACNDDLMMTVATEAESA